MATAPTIQFVSVDEYLEGELWVEWEYDNGVLAPRHSGNPEHARMVVRIIDWLAQYDSWLARYSGLVVPVSAVRFRVPDVCCYPKEINPGNDLDAQQPPLAVFEVLSPGNKMSEMQAECEDYARLSIPYVFILDPERKVVLVPRAGGFPALEADMTFQYKGHTALISLTDLFEGFSGDTSDEQALKR